LLKRLSTPIVIAALLLTSVAGSAAALPPATPEGKIALVQTDRRALYITDFQGRVQRKVTLPRSRKLIGSPSFNRQGSRLWFLAGDGPVERKRMWLHVVPAQGRSPGRSLPLRLTGHLNSSPLVSANERRIAVSTISGRRQACAAFAIVTSAGRTVRRFEGGPGVEITALGWSPDSSRLLYTRANWGDFCGKLAGSASLLLAGRAGVGPSKRLAAQRLGFFQPAPVWSPDGRRVAWQQLDQRSLKTALRVLEPASGRGRLLARDAYPTRIAWSADTDEIFSLRAEPNNDGLWAFDPDSSRRRHLDGGDIVASSADGSRLAIYHSTTARQGILDVTRGTFWPFPRDAIKRAIAYFIR
jgi:dipeptidyl aminopeptidase/acylaminoacyl peptidase